MQSIDLVILAAGKGTRMRSHKPKVLHELAGKPLLGYLFELFGDSCNTHVVVGHGAEQVKQHFNHLNYNWVEQRQQLGTGHAVQQVLNDLQDSSITLILSGDVPLIQTATLNQLLEQVSATSMGLLTVNMDNPSGYGRIVRNANSTVEAIVEHKDATAQQLQINEINTGIMAIPTPILKQLLPELDNNNAQREYYLTDFVAKAVKAGYVVNTTSPEYSWEVEGINDRYQLQQLERQWQNHLAQQVARSGFGFADCQRVDIRGNISFGNDCYADVNTIFAGDVELGNQVTIGANSIIINAKIGNNVTIHPNSMIENAIIGDRAQIGPYARLRPGTELKEGSKVGNFVETKNTVLGIGSKANHLAYVGDAVVGVNSNIGAGVITCNYDGANKHQTTIGNNAFIGSNSSLIAPVRIGDGATVGASSAIGKDISNHALGLTRSKQVECVKWQRPTKNNKL